MHLFACYHLVIVPGRFQGKGTQRTFWLHGEYGEIVDPLPPNAKLLDLPTKPPQQLSNSSDWHLTCPNLLTLNDKIPLNKVCQSSSHKSHSFRHLLKSLFFLLLFST
ncbi:unnamed protein product [Protopolystoma xenopodis]|uniref:Uncharacterized protein n=1 Tax=Protopolystoma xenopodis TaxID=117903 RepID=A0A448WMU1_9PLAT|nr:unnamed protein product [Protopolystoma xenopodis]